MDGLNINNDDYTKFKDFLCKLITFYRNFNHLFINSLNDLFLEEIFVVLKNDKLINDTIEIIKLFNYNIEQIFSSDHILLKKHEISENNMYYQLVLIFDELISNPLISKYKPNKGNENLKNNYKIKKKKSYEVENLSEFIIKKLDKNNIKSILELGCGKSYLTNNILIKNEDIIYVGIDKKEDLIKKPLIKKNKNIVLMNYFIEHYNFSQFYKDNLKDHIKLDNNNLLFGLHSCGNLTSDCLKIFKDNNCFSHLIIVGCCLNLLKEYINKQIVNSNLFGFYFKNIGVDKKNKFLEETLIYEDNYEQIGFPLSKEIKVNYSENFFFGRTVRNAAMQNYPKPQDLKLTVKDNPNYKKLLFRAILQVFFEKYIPNLKHYYGFGKVILDKTKDESFLDFNDYLIKMLDILRENYEKNCQLFKNSNEILNLVEKEKILKIISTDEYKDFFTKYFNLQNYLWSLNLLRLKFARIIELIVAVDRVLFLFESGFIRNKLIEIFDKSVSVRNFLIYSHK